MVQLAVFHLSVINVVIKFIILFSNPSKGTVVSQKSQTVLILSWTEIFRREYQDAIT